MRKGSATVAAVAIVIALAGCGGESEPTNAERPADVTPEVLAETALPTPTPEPVEPEALTYTVQSGDLLGTIAANAGVSLDALLAANPQITDPNTLQVGDVVTIPAVEPAPSETAPPDAADDGGDDTVEAPADDDGAIPDN